MKRIAVFILAVVLLGCVGCGNSNTKYITIKLEKISYEKSYNGEPITYLGRNVWYKRVSVEKETNSFYYFEDWYEDWISKNPSEKTCLANLIDRSSIYGSLWEDGERVKEGKLCEI